MADPFSGGTIAGNVSPDVTGRSLGAQGTAEWDVNAQNVHASGTVTMTGSLASKKLEGIAFADQYSGVSVTAKIDAALADVPTQGLVVIPSTMAVGAPTSIPSLKCILDLRNPDINGIFKIYTNYSTTLPAFSLTDAGVLYQIRAAAVSQNAQMFGITSEPFERAIFQMDGTAAGRSKSLQLLFGAGYDIRDLAISRNSVNIYSTGTVDVANNSTSVVGHGTSWTTDMIGQAFITNADPNRAMNIAAVPSATSITLSSVWGGSTATGGTYSIQTPVLDSSSGYFISVNNRKFYGKTSGGSQVILAGVNNSATNHYEYANALLTVNSTNGKTGINVSAPTAYFDVQTVDNTNGILLHRTGGNIYLNAFTDGSGNGDLQVNDSTGTAKIDLNAAGTSTISNPLSVAQTIYPKTDVVLVNGANSDIALSGTSFARITGPTGAFSVSGFAAGVNGRILHLFNSVAFAMTITNEATSTTTNRITTLTGADVVLRAGKSFASFIYDSGTSRWILMSTN